MKHTEFEASLMQKKLKTILSVNEGYLLICKNN